MLLSTDELNTITKPCVNNTTDLDRNVLGITANRVNKMKGLGASALISLIFINSLIKDGVEIDKAISTFKLSTISSINNMFKKVANHTYNQTKPYYLYRGIKFKPLRDNENIKSVVSSYLKNAHNTVKSIYSNPMYVLKNPKTGIKTYYPIKNVYDMIIEQAKTCIYTNQDLIDKVTPILNQIEDTGIKVKYNDKYYKLDDLLKNVILTNLTAMSQAILDECGKEYKADGKEISVHMNPALDHELLQGHRFTNAEYEKLNSSLPFKDVDGRQYKAIKRHIGQWNCRHYSISVILAMQDQTFTNKVLDEIVANNHKGVKFKDKHLTRYDCNYMRYQYEAKLTKYKTYYKVMVALGNMQMATFYNTKYNALYNMYISFCKHCNLKPNPIY